MPLNTHHMGPCEQQSPWCMHREEAARERAPCAARGQHYTASCLACNDSTMSRQHRLLLVNGLATSALLSRAGHCEQPAKTAGSSCRCSFTSSEAHVQLHSTYEYAQKGHAPSAGPWLIACCCMSQTVQPCLKSLLCPMPYIGQWRYLVNGLAGGVVPVAGDCLAGTKNFAGTSMRGIASLCMWNNVCDLHNRCIRVLHCWFSNASCNRTRAVPCPRMFGSCLELDVVVTEREVMCISLQAWHA